MLQLGCFGVEIGKIGNLGRINRGQQVELVQCLGKRRGDEQHVEAFAARGRNLAHDFFIGGMDGDFEINAGFGLELLGNVLGHVAVPIGNHEFFGLGHGNADHHGKCAAHQECRNMLEFHSVSLPCVDVSGSRLRAFWREFETEAIPWKHPW